jgi:hypothetical protein
MWRNLGYNENPGIEAVRMLANMGYRFTVTGETIKGKYHGQYKPDPAQVRPLVDVMKAHKPDVVYFLKSYCPRCGGVCFIGSMCMACDWEQLVERCPDLQIRQ